jgi:predicted TIM-barrel fold metal-dependent hydrolase
MSLVVDCDSHVMEPADLWQTYLEPRYRDRAIRVERREGVEHLIIGEQSVLSGLLAVLGGAHRDRAQLFTGELSYADGCEPASYDPAARAMMLDDWGVDVGVLFPTIGILPFPTDDNDLANAYCRAYNRWQREFLESAPGRVAPIALVNWRDVPAAAAELDTCLKAGFRGLFVPPEVIDGVRPGEAHFDPLWRQCEAAGVPGCTHVIVRFGGAGGFGQWGETRPGPVFSFSMGATSQLMPALAAMITDQLFARFPRLKLVNVEAGCGWAAYLMDRMDEKYDRLGPLAPLPMKPSEYIRRNCYFVAEPEERSIGAMLDLVGEDRILWGSDYPHVDATLDAPKLIRGAIAGLGPERQAAVLGENARKVFGLA